MNRLTQGRPDVEKTRLWGVPPTVLADGKFNLALRVRQDARRAAPCSRVFSTSGLLLFFLLLGLARPACADDPKTEIYGTIVSVRGNILAVRPSLRPKMTRIAFGEKTQIVAYERASPALLKPGMRVNLGGRYSEKEGFQAQWVEAAEKPLGTLAEKSTGVQQHPEGFASLLGTLKSVKPLVVTDDSGKDYAANSDNLRGVWRVSPGDRNSLLIGVRINAQGTVASDGVVQASVISPDKDYAQVGTMFGEIVAVHGGALDIRPRYTSDTLPIAIGNKATLLRQINIDPDSIKVGDKLTFWALKRPETPDAPKSEEVLAIALLLGKYRYPASAGQEGGIFLSGKLTSLDPVQLALPNGKTIPVLIPAQMPVARLEPIPTEAITPGSQVMLVLSRRPDGTFQTSTVILDASPWVGYGG